MPLGIDSVGVVDNIAAHSACLESSVDCGLLAPHGLGLGVPMSHEVFELESSVYIDEYLY